MKSRFVRLALVVVVSTLAAFVLSHAAYAQGAPVLANAQATGSTPEKVRFIVNRCLARDYTTINGMQRISWVSPGSADYQEMASIGVGAVEPLSLLLDDPNDFVQLLAVKFLIDIGGPSIDDPLVRATGEDKWVVVRLAGMDGLAQSLDARKITRLRALVNDNNALVAKRARDIVDHLNPGSSNR